MSKAKRLALAAVSGLSLVAIALFLSRECAYGGGMPGWYRACECKGIERLDYDQTAADGKRRTLCLGLVTDRKCYRHQGGPEVACELLPPR